MKIQPWRIVGWVLAIGLVAGVVNEFYPFQLLGKVHVHEHGTEKFYSIVEVNGESPERLAHGFFVTRATDVIVTPGRHAFSVMEEPLGFGDKPSPVQIITVTIEAGHDYTLSDSKESLKIVQVDQ